MIQIYEKKQTLVGTIQWNGDNYVEVTKFIIKNTKKPIQYFTHCGFDTFTINFHSKDVRVVKSGDYIVVENADVLVVPEDVFKKNYESIGARSEHLEESTGVYEEIADEEPEIDTWAMQKIYIDLIKLLESMKQELETKNII